MSCRIIGRNIEFVFIGYIIKELANKGYKTLDSDYIQSSKNALVENFYDKVGFNYIGNINGTKKYGIKIQNFQIKKIDYIKLVFN